MTQAQRAEQTRHTLRKIATVLLRKGCEPKEAMQLAQTLMNKYGHVEIITSVKPEPTPVEALEVTQIRRGMKEGRMEEARERWKALNARGWGVGRLDEESMAVRRAR